jgi:hypothetical protein
MTSDAQWKAANERYRRFAIQIEDQLQKERPAEARDLMSWMETPTGYGGIYIQYFPFSLWMFRFDEGRKRPLSVNINSYSFQRKLHKDQVSDALADIAGPKSGEALFNEIMRTGKKIFILPFWKFGKTAYKNANDFFPSKGPDATTLVVSKPDDRRRYDVAIEFTASMWGPVTFDPVTNIATGTSGFAGPSTEPDEVLFHEMVHATRRMRGYDDHTEISAGYENKEEFIAVTVTNVYLTEKAPQRLRLRSGHEGFGRLADPDHFLDNTQHINISPRQLLRELFHSRQAQFMIELGKIPPAKAPWNPFRIVGQELQLVQ